MNKNFVLFGILASILMGGFGLFLINDSFAEDNLSVSGEDSEAYKKQLEKAEERKQKLEEKQEKAKQKAEERKQKLEEKKAKLDSDRKKLEEKISKKSEEIRKKLQEKQEKLDARTQKILDKINDRDYLGKKLGSSISIDTYELVFDSATTTGIHDKTQTSTLEGFMIFNTFDKGKSNLKLELQECKIVVDDVPFNCGFGKARTTSSGDSDSKDSLVILAFLEDDVLEEVHSTLKISLNADSPIRDIEDSSQVSILSPQSKISGMWLIDGMGTLTKTVSTTDDTTNNEISVELSEEVDFAEN